MLYMSHSAGSMAAHFLYQENDSKLIRHADSAKALIYGRHVDEKHDKPVYEFCILTQRFLYLYNFIFRTVEIFAKYEQRYKQRYRKLGKNWSAAKIELFANANEQNELI